MERQSRAEHDDGPLQNRSAGEPEPDASEGLAKVRNRDAAENGKDRSSNNWRKMAQQGRDSTECQGQTEAR